MKTASVFFANKFKSIIRSPLFWLDTLLMCVFTAVSFFVSTRFFSPAGTSSLTPYFVFVPYASIILLPAFCLKKDSVYDSFVPLSEMKKLLLNFSAHITAYGIMLLFLMWLPVFVSFFGDVDFGACILSFAALLFFGLSSVALCFLVSSVVEKSVPSFAVSSLILAAFNFCHRLASDFTLPRFFTSLFYSIGFAGRFDSASKGIFRSSDFIFYIVSAALFIVLSFLISELKKGRVFDSIEKRRLVYVALLFVLLFANNQRFGFKADFSEEKIYSVSKYTKELLKQNDETVTVHFYKSGKLESLYPSIKNVSEFLRQYERAGKSIKLVVTDCDKDEKAREFLNNYGIYPQRIRTENSTSTEFIDVYSSVIIEAAGNIEVIPFVLTPASLEYQMDTKILSLVYNFESKLNVLSGNGQSLDDDFRLLKDWFENQGIEVSEVYPDNLQELQGPLFVIGEDYLSYSDVEQIESYAIDGKGSVLFMNSPYSVDVHGDWSVTENKSLFVTELLSRYGIDYRPSFVMDYSCQRISMLSEENAQSGYSEIMNYPLWISVLPQENALNGCTVFWTSPLDLSENAVPFIFSSAHSFEQMLDFDNEQSFCNTNPFTVNLQNVQTMSLQNYVIGSVVPVKCTDNVSTKSCFYVISDQNFASYYTNGFIGGETGDFRNFSFLTNLFLKMNGMEELAALQSRTVKDRSLYKRSSVLK